MKKRQSFAQQQPRGREQRPRSESISTQKKASDSIDRPLTKHSFSATSLPELSAFDRLTVGEDTRQSKVKRKDGENVLDHEEDELDEKRSSRRRNQVRRTNSPTRFGELSYQDGFETPPKVRNNKRDSKTISSESERPEEVEGVPLDRTRTTRSTPPPASNDDFAKRRVGERWQGRLDYPNSSFYTGGLLKKNSTSVVRDGVGTAYDSVKNKVYEGNFEDDLKSGFGTTRYTDKLHQGQYFRGLRHGYGVFTFENGERYEGQFVHGEFHGDGKLYWKDGSNVEGTFKKGKIRRGVKHWPERHETYEGTFDEKCQPSGFGKTSYVDGSYHRGMYRQGVPHGTGERYDADLGVLVYQDYHNGTLAPHARTIIVKKEKCVFAGEVETNGNKKNFPFRSVKKDMQSLIGVVEGSVQGDEDTPEQDQIRVQMGRFQVRSDFPPDLVEGTYATARSKVTSQRFDPGPVVAENFAGYWHDMDTNNVRWARLGLEHAGPIGTALYVFGNGANAARIETFRQEGELVSAVNLN